MITIPTSELLGLITDVAGFAPDVKTDPHHGILITWDPERDRLITAATDVLSGATSWWVPGEGEERALTEGDDDQTHADVMWGSDEDTGGDHDRKGWSIFIALEDAMQIVKVFKLPAKKRLTPLTVSVNFQRSRLVVARDRTEHITGATLNIQTPDQTISSKFPDIEAIHRAATATMIGADGSHPLVQFPTVLRYNPSRLATFGAVRGHELHQLYCGEEHPTAFSMGDRFRAFLWPAGSVQNAYAAAGAAKLSDALPIETEMHPAEVDGDE